MVRINKINFLKIVFEIETNENIVVQEVGKEGFKTKWKDYFWIIIGRILIGQFWPSCSDQSEESILLNRSRMSIPHISIALCKINGNIWIDVQYNSIVILFEANPHRMRGTVCHCYKFLVFWKMENWNSFRNQIGLKMKIQETLHALLWFESDGERSISRVTPRLRCHSNLVTPIKNSIELNLPLWQGNRIILSRVTIQDYESVWHLVTPNDSCILKYRCSFWTFLLRLSPKFGVCHQNVTKILLPL